MPYTSRVEASFSGAHHNGPEGNKCRNNHGHDWLVVVEYTYTKLNEYGWGPDFGAIKSVINLYDHGVGGDLNEKLAPLPPSAENIAKDIYKRLAEWFGYPPDFVTVHEGKGNSVRYAEMSPSPTPEELAIKVQDIFSVELPKVLPEADSGTSVTADATQGMRRGVGL